MNTLFRHTHVFLALTAVCMAGVARGAGIAASGEAGSAAFTPTAVQGITSSVGGLFASKAPDLMTLGPILSSLKGADLGDPQTRAALAPVFAAVQAQVQTLQSRALALDLAKAQRGGAPLAAETSALAAKYVALDVLRDFQLPETRSHVAEVSLAYHGELTGVEQASIRANLVMLHMESMAQALGRTNADEGRAGPVGKEPQLRPVDVAAWAHSPSVMSAWTLQPATARQRAAQKIIPTFVEAAPAGTPPSIIMNRGRTGPADPGDWFRVTSARRGPIQIGRPSYLAGAYYGQKLDVLGELKKQKGLVLAIVSTGADGKKQTVLLDPDVSYVVQALERDRSSHKWTISEDDRGMLNPHTLQLDPGSVMSATLLPARLEEYDPIAAQLGQAEKRNLLRLSVGGALIAGIAAWPLQAAALLLLALQVGGGMALVYFGFKAVTAPASRMSATIAAMGKTVGYLVMAAGVAQALGTIAVALGQMPAAALDVSNFFR